MSEWCRDIQFARGDNDTLSIHIYALPAYAANELESKQRQLEVLDKVLESSMVALVNLYQQSVGGYIDAEARSIIASEERKRENRLWKWMFATREKNESEITDVRDAPASEGDDRKRRKISMATTKVRPALSLTGSSKYLLFEQVPVTSESDRLYDQPSEATLNSNAYFIAPWKMEQQARAAVPRYRLPERTFTEKGDGTAGVAFKDVNYTTTPAECGVAPLQVLKSYYQQAAEATTGVLRVLGKAADLVGAKKVGAGASAVREAAEWAQAGNLDWMSDPEFTRCCTYKLVAGTPLHAQPITEGLWSESRHEEVKATVQKVCDEQIGPFTAAHSTVLGHATAYDGLGPPTSSWFATARFKAYMGAVNRKRKALGSEVSDFDYSGTDGYVTSEVPTYEETAVSYPYKERMADAHAIAAMTVKLLLGRANETWYIPPTAIAYLQPGYLANLDNDVARDSSEGATLPRFNLETKTWMYTDPDETWESLFIKTAPTHITFLHGSNPKERFLHLRSQVKMTPRSKYPVPGWIRTETPALHYNNVPDVSSVKVGCGFSEHVAHDVGAAGESLTDLIVNASSLLSDAADPDLKTFMDSTAASFTTCFQGGRRNTNEFVLVPAAKGIAACGEVSIDPSAWVVGAAPALTATAARIALQFVHHNTGRVQRLGSFATKVEDHQMWYGTAMNWTGQYRSTPFGLLATDKDLRAKIAYLLLYCGLFNEGTAFAALRTFATGVIRAGKPLIAGSTDSHTSGSTFEPANRNRTEADLLATFFLNESETGNYVFNTGMTDEAAATLHRWMKMINPSRYQTIMQHLVNNKKLEVKTDNNVAMFYYTD